MAGPESGGPLGDIRCERLDPDAQVTHESLDDRDGVGSAAPGIDEDLGICARWQDQRLPMRLPDGHARRRMVRVARVEERDNDARVEDDYRHSRRSFCRDPFGYTPVRRPA